jgi:hypothetical protein
MSYIFPTAPLSIRPARETTNERPLDSPRRVSRLFNPLDHDSTPISMEAATQDVEALELDSRRNWVNFTWGLESAKPGLAGRGASIVADGWRGFWAWAFMYYFVCIPCPRFPVLETIIREQEYHHQLHSYKARDLDGQTPALDEISNLFLNQFYSTLII